MPIYDFDVNIVSEKLMPPELRQPAHLAWFKVILKPLQWLWQLVFVDYSQGTSYAAYTGITYNPGDRVLWTDNGNYENILSSIAIPPTGNALSSDHWIKIQDSFVGADKRIKYNSQIIVLEYSLNEWFLVQPSDPQIYIENSNNLPVFLMGDSGPTSSLLVDNSLLAESAMCDVYVAGQTEFTVYFPAALFASLPPALTLDKEKIIRNFIDKYRMAGITYTITTY